MEPEQLCWPAKGVVMAGASVTTGLGRKQRETAAEKARRYLAEGRLVVTVVDLDCQVVRATCRGDGVLHSLGFHRRLGWWCSCPSRSGRCCHLLALRSVTAVDLPEPH